MVTDEGDSLAPELTVIDEKVTTEPIYLFKSITRPSNHVPLL